MDQFPQQVGYYPFPFDLVPFGDEALYRMLVFELPQGEPLPPPPVLDPAGDTLAMLRSVAPDPLEYTYVGELYGQIANGFRTLDPATLFIGPRQAQVDNDWSVELDMHAMDDPNLQRRRDQALAAIDDIVRDGEGAPAQRATSHFGRFSAVRQAYTDSGRAAARPVVRNPQTRDQPADPGNVLTDQNSASARGAVQHHLRGRAHHAGQLLHPRPGNRRAAQRPADHPRHD